MVCDVIDSVLMPELLGLATDIGESTGSLQKRINELEARMPEADEQLLDRVARLLHGWMPAAGSGEQSHARA
jgi:hypothetical protein